jgi:hypothetical protein
MTRAGCGAAEVNPRPRATNLREKSGLGLASRSVWRVIEDEWHYWIDDSLTYPRSKPAVTVVPKAKPAASGKRAEID